MMKVEEKDTVLMSSLGNPKPTKEASFTFLCSGYMLSFFIAQCNGILSFGKEDTKNTIGNHRNKVSHFILEKGTKDSHSKTIPFDFQCLLPLLFLVQLLFLSVSFSNATPSLEWKNDTSYPFALEPSVALVGQDDCIYVFGGFNTSNDAFSNSYKYKITAGSPKEWIEIASMPTAIGGAAGCLSNDGRFFIFGGNGNLQIYNATDNSWNTGILNEFFFVDSYMSCAVDSSSGLMYITGGTSDGARFYSYDVGSNTVTNLSTSSTPFYLVNQGSFVNDGNLYIFGGFDHNTGSYSAITYIYDIAYSSWSNGGNMTQAAGYFGYATDGSRFYAIGGAGNFGLLDYTQVYDISSGNWSVNNGTVYSGGIMSNAVVFLDGSLHSIGGLESNNNMLSVQLVSTVCGVYNYSGPCYSINQCLLNTTCSNGECTGQSKNCSGSTCDPSTGECVNHTSSSSSTTTSSSTTSSSTICSTSIPSSIIAGFTFGLLIFLH